MKSQKRLLVRLGAILMVVALFVASALGWQPLGVAAMALCVLAAAVSVCGHPTRASPFPWELDYERRRRAHGRSQSYLSRFGVASLCLSEDKMQPMVREKLNRFKVYAGTRVADFWSDSQHSGICYRARDQPYGSTCTLVG